MGCPKLTYKTEKEPIFWEVWRKSDDTIFEVDWYDYETRQYDPARPGWNSPDPMAESTPGISPYAYCFNNPVSHNDPTGMFGENTNNAWTSTFIKPDGTVIEHIDDGDPRVYMVFNEEAWKKGGKKKDGLPVVGFEDPNKNYKPGDQYTFYNPTEDPNYKGQYLIPDEAYDYSQEEIEGKFSEDWAYIIYGNDGVAVSRWAKVFWRDLSAPGNRGTVVSAGVDAASVIPILRIGKLSVPFKGLTAHGVNQAITRGIKPQTILNVIKNGTSTLATGRYGAQIRYTLDKVTVVIATEGRNAGKIVTIMTH